MNNFFILYSLLAKPQFLYDVNSNFLKIPVQLGDDITLKCPFENFNHFEWLKNEEPLDNNHMLHPELKNVSFEDAGKKNILKPNWLVE